MVSSKSGFEPRASTQSDTLMLSVSIVFQAAWESRALSHYSRCQAPRRLLDWGGRSIRQKMKWLGLSTERPPRQEEKVGGDRPVTVAGH